MLLFQKATDDQYRRCFAEKRNNQKIYEARTNWFALAAEESGVLEVLMTGTALAFTGGEYLPQAKMTPAEARQIALKAYPGKIISEELEKESGGSGLRYSFVISNQKAKHEVGVDAKTCAILENSVGAKLPTELQSAPPAARPLF